MRMRQYGLLKCHRGIFCELFTFTTSICRLFSGAEWRILVLRSTNVFLKVSRHFYDESESIVAFIGQSFLSENSTSKTRWMLLRPNISLTFFEQQEKVSMIFFVKQLSYSYFILLNSITLKSNLLVSGIQWFIKRPFCRDTAFSPFRWLVYLEILPFSPHLVND